MTYLVLARKYRPQTFDEVVGQDHITDILKKAVKSDRLTHGFLFCGPRGIGKTSCARILAKSLNCTKGPTLKPCGKCPACLEIARGASFDCLEIDGASNRGIDEIRTLRENVKFAPACGKYKIYIVDEVHMLTPEAFNALLKTLEEPPAHVKFIFATTAPNKVPATVVSRCQRFDFKRIAIKTIVALLADVGKKEKFKAGEDALYAVAKAADGSLRDALSIFDQLGALTDGGIVTEDVFSMLGLVETELLFGLADALAQKDCPSCLQALEKIIEKGKDVKQLSRDITEHFRHLMVIKVGGKALGKLVDYPVAVKEMFLTQSKKFELKDILTAIDTFIGAQETARITESARMPLEVAFAKLTYQGEQAGRDEPAAVERQATPPPAAKAPPPKTRAYSPAEVLRDRKGQVDISGGMDLNKIRKVWDVLTHAVSLEKMSLATYLQEGAPYDMTGNTLTIGFPKRCRFHKESLEDKRNIEFVEKVFSDKLKTTVIIQYALVDDARETEEPENVKEALDTFKGKVVSKWHSE